MTDLKDKITRKDYSLVIIWAVGILLLFVIGSIIGARILKDYKANTEKTRQAWIESRTMDLDEAVKESEVMKNPQNYIDKQIWQKPPFRYEVVITLKRIKAD